MKPANVNTTNVRFLVNFLALKFPELRKIQPNTILDASFARDLE